MFALRHRHRVLLLGQGTVTVGRKSTCELMLDDVQASREHARMIISDQSAAIEDLGSANGVFVNGKRIHGLVRLSTGDKIKIGQQEIEVVGFSDEQELRAADTESTVTHPTVSAEELRSEGVSTKYDDVTDVTSPVRETSVTHRPPPKR
jgi:pSer/pThr/pTyr-binding forkhead associated (FHA) protein